MPHLIGLQLHSNGIAVAALLPDQTIAQRPVDDLASVMQRAAAQRWKWSLGVEGREANAMSAAHALFLGLQHAMGDDDIVACVAVPERWSERAREALLLALEGTRITALQLVRDTTALAVAAAVIDRTIEGVCAFVHVGTHKLEVTLAEVSPGTIRALARHSVLGLDSANVRQESLLPLITEVAHFATEEAKLTTLDVRRFVCTGARAVHPALANPLGGVFNLAAEIFPGGTIALGAAQVAVGLTGMGLPWKLLDDLGQAPLARHRSRQQTRAVRAPTPTPAPPVQAPTNAAVETPRRDNHDVGETYRATSPPPADRATGAARVADAGANVHPSSAPPSERAIEVAPAGSFAGLPTLEAVCALQLLSPMDSTARPTPDIATLINQFGFLRTATGFLTLSRRGDEVTLPIDRGGVCVSEADHARAMRPFEWPDGAFTWRPAEIPRPTLKHRVPMTTFVTGGLRVRLRGVDDAELARCHRAQLRLAPSVRDERRGRVARIDLTEAERRAVAHVFDGSRSFEVMLGEGYVGRNTLHRLVVLLDLYGVLRWAEPAPTVHADPVAEMTRLLAHIEGRDHFLALGVHWSASPAEIHTAWEAMQAHYGPGGPMHRLAPALAARIVQRGAAAWAVLQHDDRRVQHRREAYPGRDEDLLAPLVEARAKALEMRGDSAEARHMLALRDELRVTEARSKPRGRP